MEIKASIFRQQWKVIYPILCLLIGLTMGVDQASASSLTIETEVLSEANNKYRLHVSHPTHPDSLNYYFFIWEMEGRFYEFGESIVYTFRNNNHAHPRVKLIASWRSSRYAGDDDPGNSIVRLAPDAIQLNANSTTPNEKFSIALGRDPRPGFSTTYRIKIRQAKTSCVLEFRNDPDMSMGANCEPWFAGTPPFSEWVIPIDSLNEAFPNSRFYQINAPENGLDLMVPVCASAGLRGGDEITAEVYFYQGSSKGERISFQKHTATVVDSWDPNSKVGFPLDFFVPGQYLEYTIHFENLGTAFEDSVVVTDTLPEGLDPSTLVVVNSSHPFVTAHQEEQSVFQWQFAGNGFLLLAPRGNYRKQSQGFVTYRVKTKPDQTIGALLRNRAAIHFGLAQTTVMTDYSEHLYPIPEKFPCDEIPPAQASNSWTFLHYLLGLILLLTIVYLLWKIQRQRKPLTESPSS